jgi:hypothetical protein
MAQTSKLTEVKLSHGEICELINGLTVRALTGGLDKETRKLGRKLSAALKKLDDGSKK